MSTRSSFAPGRFITSTLLGFALVSACNEEPPTGPSERPEVGKAAIGPTVTATDPSAAPQDTTLDVRVLGSGFDLGSKAEFALDGVVGPKVRSNRTTYRTSKELVANVTIAIDAVPDRYDVIVTTSKGKKGIGTERFAVLAIQLLGAGSLGMGINTTGTVVGYEVTAICGGGNRPMVWTEAGGLRQLPVPEGTCNAAAKAINDGGTIVGSANNAAYRWLPGSGETWTFEKLPGLDAASPQDINGGGDIVLLHNDGNIEIPRWIGTLWIEGTGVVHLPDLPGATRGCSSKGLNNLRQAVGYCVYRENENLTPVIWLSPQTEPTALPLLPGIVRSWSNAINDAGVIVGVAQTSSGVNQAVRWIPSGGTWVVEDLGSLGGKSEAKAINNRGQIAGFSRVGGSSDHAFVWEEGSGMRDLGTLGSQGSQAWGINDPDTGAPTLATGWSYVSATPHMVLWRIQ
jgi:probable HAF family extracellular repeat protein